MWRSAIIGISSRLLVEIAAVLDRIDARLDRDAQPGAAERVAHHATAERVRLVDERLHLLERELGILRPVAGARAGAAGGRALDVVRAGADHRAHRRPHRLDAVGNARGQARIAAAGAPCPEGLTRSPSRRSAR